jgi:hypothetical protein
MEGEGRFIQVENLDIKEIPGKNTAGIKIK